MSVAVTWCTGLQPSQHKWTSLFITDFITTVILDDAEKIISKIKMMIDGVKCSLP
jgi:hypothetical protein